MLGNRSNQSPLPLSFPVEGEGIRAPCRLAFFISRPLAQPQTQFSKEIAKATKIWEIDTFEVLFAKFVVKCLGPPWLRPCLAAGL